MTSNGGEQTFDVPKKCKAGVVVDEGPNFRVEVQEVDVPEIGTDIVCRRTVLSPNKQYRS